LRDLEMSRDRARAIFEASPIGLGAVTQDSRMTDLNGDLVRILGLESPGTIDPDIMALVPQELKHQVEQLFDMALTKGRAGPIESELRHGKGNYIPVRLLARRLPQRDGMLVLLGVEDISETRRLQSRLLQTQKIQAIGQLAGGVTHDFNNLLCVIMANAAILRNTLDMDAATASPIDHIEQASERAAALTSQPLTFSRQEMIQMRRLDLSVIIRESEMLLRRLIDDDIRLEVIVDDDIPAVRGDAGQIQQVVMNLVINAREALHGTGGHIEVHLSSIHDAADRPAATIIVSDDGPGIDADARSKIFQPFSPQSRMARAWAWPQCTRSLPDWEVQSMSSPPLDRARTSQSRFRLPGKRGNLPENHRHSSTHRWKAVWSSWMMNRWSVKPPPARRWPRSRKSATGRPSW
jgi:PAS domain S-box-containing protein